jgi:hypothetical protein
VAWAQVRQVRRQVPRQVKSSWVSQTSMHDTPRQIVICRVSQPRVGNGQSLVGPGHSACWVQNCVQPKNSVSPQPNVDGANAAGPGVREADVEVELVDGAVAVGVGVVDGGVAGRSQRSRSPVVAEDRRPSMQTRRRLRAQDSHRT